MKCYQCSKPPMWAVTEKQIPLCLDCYLKYSQVTQSELENNERWMNYLQDEMAASVGMPPMGPRFPPRPRPVILGGVRMNNINVSNSVVGTINTGTIGIIDQSISALIQTGQPEVAEAVKALSEAVLRSNDLTPNQKTQVVESLSVVSEEAVAPPERRRGVLARTLLDNAMKVTALANDITDICQKCWPVLLGAFASVA